MLFGRVNVGEGWETALMVREESGRIRGFGPGPRVETRTALITEGRVPLIPLLVQIGPEGSRGLYESWLNPEPEHGFRHLQDLARQPRLLALLYGDRGRERNIAVPNGWSGSFVDMLGAVRALPSWSMRAFDRARDAIYARHPNPAALWGWLGEQS